MCACRYLTAAERITGAVGEYLLTLRLKLSMIEC